MKHRNKKKKINQRQNIKIKENNSRIKKVNF